LKPLVELHLHLDGSLRLATMLDIARAEGVRLPASDEDGLRRALACGEVRGSLAQYLEHFDHTTAVMQTREALTRIAIELMEDCAADGLRYVEVRYMPALSARGGLVEEEAVEAILDGLTIGGMRHALGWGFIACSLRHLDPSATARTVEVAVRYRRNGVVGVDLAGDDALPALDHAPHFRRAKEAGLNVTIHAAESGPPARIREAVELFGADRVADAVNAIRDARMMDLLMERGGGVEACLTSNVQTRAVGMIDLHPAWVYLKDGILVGLNTDNRTLAGTTMARELELARDAWKLDDGDMAKLVSNAIEMSFASDAAKAALRAELADGSP
jgi:adenosine deaminase